MIGANNGWKALAVRPDLAGVGPEGIGLAAGKISTERLMFDARPDENPSGVAVIDVRGGLVARSSWWGHGYDELAKEVAAAAADAAVRGVLLRFDSPGGEAANIEIASEAIRAAAQAKPVWALADTDAYSAAYWLASQAGRLLAVPKGGVGSIGVIMRHVDWSKNLEKAGVAVNDITFGARKAEFSGVAPLSDEAREWAQATVDELGREFVAAVVRGRRISERAVLETEARVLTAREAVEMGFADATASFAEAVAELSEAVKKTSSVGARRAAGEVSQMPDNTAGQATVPAAAFAGGAPPLPSAAEPAQPEQKAGASQPKVDMAALVEAMVACGSNDMALAKSLAGRCASTEAAIEVAQLHAMAPEDAREAMKALGGGAVSPSALRTAILNRKAERSDASAVNSNVQAHEGLRADAERALDLSGAVDRWNAKFARMRGEV